MSILANSETIYIFKINDVNEEGFGLFSLCPMLR